MSLLAVENVTVSFGGIAALRNVSMRVERGEIRGLIGPNGAGKTSLLNVITGLVAPRSGNIQFEQQDITALEPDRICGIGIGRTFQHVELFREETVLDNVLTGVDRHYAYRLAPAVLGLSKRLDRQARREAETLLEAFALTPHAGLRASDLPFGIQKRIDMARALAVRPRLLLLDEPVSGMSEAEANEAIATTRVLARERDIALLMVEHNMRVMMQLAERITVMHQGGIIAEGTPAEIQADRAVIDAYLGE